MIPVFRHNLSAFPTDAEIEEIARWSNRDFEGLKKQLEDVFSDLVHTQEGILNSIRSNGFRDFSDSRVHIGGFGTREPLKELFLCHKDAELTGKYDPSEMAVVTGFGPSGSPTAGTLSMMFRLVELQKQTEVPIHVSIPDLGFLNFRTLDARELLSYSSRFEAFLRGLGLSGERVCIRRQNDTDLMRTFFLVTSVLRSEDFFLNSEAAHGLYDKLHKQGSSFSTFVHYALCVADILLPVFRDGKKLIIVLSGIDEYYFSTLADIVVRRLQDSGAGMECLVSPDVRTCSLFGRLIEGLYPFVKMSKSIPESSINLDDSDEVLSQKILSCAPRNEQVILDMMMLASNWDPEKKVAAKEAFEQRSEAWRSFKKEYLELFLSLKRLWEGTAENSRPDIRSTIFCP